MFCYHKHKSKQTQSTESPCEEELHMQENILLPGTLISRLRLIF